MSIRRLSMTLSLFVLAMVALISTAFAFNTTSQLSSRVPVKNDATFNWMLSS